MEFWIIVSVWFISTFCVTLADVCSENRCENGGTCILVSHPDSYPSLCDSDICYKFVGNVTTWENALIQCADMNGTLMAFDADGEMEKLEKHFKDNYIGDSDLDEDPVRFWTRGNDMAFPNHWEWALTGTPISEEKIATRSNSIDSCLALIIGDRGIAKHLQPLLCSEQNNFICEIPKECFYEEKAYQCLCSPGYVGYRCEKASYEVCQNNECPNGDRCFKRPMGPTKYVCECNGINTMGFNCTTRAPQIQAYAIQTRSTCYGQQCTTGEYKSINYPNLYPNDREHLYLIYIPLTKTIHFEVMDLDLEIKGINRKDTLHLGSGLSYSVDDMVQFRVNETGDYTVHGDTAWIYFSSDRSTPQNHRGFQLRWVSYQEPQPLQAVENITCEHDTRVFIEYAAYGQITPERIADNNLCLDTASLYKATKRCNGLKSCTLIQADFRSDPCPMIDKTLDIRYQCVTANVTHNYDKILSVPVDTPGTTLHYCDTKEDSREDSRLQSEHIKPEQFDIQACPDGYGSEGFASRSCKGSGEWGELDLSLCSLQWLDDVLDQIEKGNILAAELAELVRNKTIDSNVEAGLAEDKRAQDLAQSVNILESLVDLQISQLNDTGKEERKSIIERFNEAFLEIGSNLLDLREREVWEEIQPSGDDDKPSLSPISVTENLQRSASLLVEELGINDPIRMQSENIVLGVSVVPSTSSGNFTFDEFSDDKVGEDVITLPILPDNTTNSTGKMQMVFFLYKTLGHLLNIDDDHMQVNEPDFRSTDVSTPTSNVSVTINPGTKLSTASDNVTDNLTIGLPTPDYTRETTSRDDLTTDEVTPNPSGLPTANIPVTKRIISHVISATINTNKKMEEEEQSLGGNEVEFTLQHTDRVESGDITCVFWKYSKYGSMDAGSWSTEGCRVISSNEHRTQCACTHLTNFAILVDHKGAELDPVHIVALEVITIVGCTISIICLAVCIFAFTYFKSLRSTRTMIHRNLCISLTVAELVFLIGVDKTQNKIVCAVIAGVLHYSFLAAFCWMFLEAFQFYKMLVLVFSTDSKHWMYYATGYGIPLIIVGATAGSNYEGYGTDKYCWLSTEGHMMLSFTGPLATIIALNLALLFISLYKAYSARSRVCKDATTKQNLGPWIKGAISMLFLLGCTWSVGLFYLSNQVLFLAYLFTILNSLQGMFIFLFYCLGNERVVTEMRKLIGRQAWLPLWFRERYGPKQKSVTITSTTDTKPRRVKRDIPTVTFVVDPPVMDENPRSWLYSTSGEKSIGANMDYESPYPDVDYE